MRRLSYIVVLVLVASLLVSCATNTHSGSSDEPSLISKLNEATAFIESKTEGLIIEVGLILGSGLGDLANEIEEPIVIDYKDIPYFMESTVAGHEGKLVIGKLEGKVVVCMQGRVHFYEGYDMEDVVFPIQVMSRLGVESVIITNAAGCVNLDWEAGDLMLIADHIKLAPESPLRGPNEDELGDRFFNMSVVYNSDLKALARAQAETLGITLREGVYMFFAGPNYETPAEIRAARILGADAVGMSTVPEVIAASHCGIKVLGISCLTNMGAGILDQPLSHEEVLETSERVKEHFKALLKSIVKNM